MCFALLPCFVVRLGKFVGARIAFRVSAVVHKVHDRDLFRELRDSSGVIRVVMREYEVVYLADAGLLGRRGDPLRVTAIKSGPACVNQQRLARRGDQQRRLAALDVDEVDIEGGGCSQSKREADYGCDR